LYKERVLRVAKAKEEISEEEIQKKIKERKLKWKAQKTSMTELTLEERKKRLGLIPTDEEKALIRKKGLDKKAKE